MEGFVDKISKLCISKYKSLPKTGKPSEKEWTVLSGIILKRSNGELCLVALATGTKCLGGSELLNTELYDIGCRLSDSHAEVLARRAFLRYLYEQIDITLNGSENDIFTLSDDKKFKLKDGISFHFFSSQTPCGDCSIFLKEDLYEDIYPPTKIRKYDSFNRKVSDHETCINNEVGPVIEDMYRTGAKCVETEETRDLRLPGINYHVVGPLRTKPGRGSPTLSLSCSDKMAKWNILGLQGALLSLLIPQIRMETVTIGGDCPFSLEAMQRGLYERFKKDSNGLNIMQSKIPFTEKKGIERKNPCPSSIIWCAVQKRNTEISVEGRKQGATKKKKGSNLFISRRVLFETFLKICDKYQQSDCQIRHPKKITYLDCKHHCIHYQKLWKELRTDSFRAWPSKPSSLQKFVL